MSRRPKLDIDRETEFRKAYWEMQRHTPKKLREQFGLRPATYSHYVKRARTAGRDVMPAPLEHNHDR